MTIKFLRSQTISFSRWLRANSPVLIIFCLLSTGCEKISGSENNASNPPVSDSNVSGKTSSKAPESSINLSKRKLQFAQMQESMQAIAALDSSKLGPEFDFHFLLPNENWEKLSHGTGDKKSSVWLFKFRDNELKVLLSCGGQKEAPEFTRSAQMVYDSSFKKDQDLTREWKVGNFTLRRSFIGYIDDRHGEVTITAFSNVCALEFNIASESMDRDELFKVADISVEEFMVKNPDGGFPKK